MPECGTALNCVQNDDRTITSVGPDVVGNATSDRIAVAVFSGIRRDDHEELFTWAVGRGLSGPMDIGEIGGNIAVDVTGLVLVGHTHPYFREGRLEPENRATNQANRTGGYGDHVNVIRYGVPNYFRTPYGVVKALERRNNQIVERTVTGSDRGTIEVWIRPRSPR